MKTKPDPYAGQGGSYIVKNGKRERVEEPTQDHPDGNCARGADGKPVPAAHEETAKAAGDAEAPAAGGDPSLPPGGEVAAGGNNNDDRR